jgi:transcriptional regulator with XRE-family HTH domain
MNERIKRLRKEHKLSQVKFADMLGITQSVVSLMESGHSNVSVDVLRKLSEQFGVSVDWLVYGKDNYVRLSRENSFIPLINVEAKAGYIENHIDDSFMEKLDLYKIPGFEKGDHRIFEVEGDSMVPTIMPRDWIICRGTGLDNLIEGSLCVIVTGNDIVVKRVYKDRENPKVVILKSDNSDYNDMSIRTQDIAQLWAVQAKITNSFVSGSMENVKRMDDLENELKEIKGQLSELLKTLKNGQ